MKPRAIDAIGHKLVDRIIRSIGSVSVHLAEVIISTQRTEGAGVTRFLPRRISVELQALYFANQDTPSTCVSPLKRLMDRIRRWPYSVLESRSRRRKEKKRKQERDGEKRTIRVIRGGKSVVKSICMVPRWKRDEGCETTVVVVKGFRDRNRWFHAAGITAANWNSLGPLVTDN